MRKRYAKARKGISMYNSIEQHITQIGGYLIRNTVVFSNKGLKLRAGGSKQGQSS